MSKINHRGIVMEAEQLKKMDATAVLWMAIQLSGVKRKDIEKAQDWPRGTIDRWCSNKDDHLPNMDDLVELVIMTAHGRPVEGHILVQWLIARADDGALQYDVPAITPDELARMFVEFSADFGASAVAAFEALKDQQIIRVEALRMNRALADIISTAQQIQMGLVPYV